ncbi:MAG: hypothetical protein ABI723_06975 [Bacteroidia bacterium]
MIVKEQLKYFFKTGLLKNISYGLTRNELTNILGNTDWKHFSSNRDFFPVIYKYGRLEFYFENKTKAAKLNGVMFQPIPSSAINGNLNCNYHRLTKNTDIKKAIQFLKINNIKFEEKPNEWDNESRLLLTEGNVSIFFDCQKTAGHYLLHKAGKFIIENEPLNPTLLHW